MHYYQFNIGDYASHTSRLTPIEDLAYRRLLDLYYLNEQPLNGCVKEVSREIGLSDYLPEVEYVLKKFFTLDEDVYKQKRIEIEIKKYKSNARNKSKAGKASAKARQAKASSKLTGVEQVLNSVDAPLDKCSTGEQLNINHKPLTNNHKTVTKKQVKDKAASPPVDFSTLGMSDYQLSEMKRIRKQNKGGPLTQRVVNGLAKEFHEACSYGNTFDDVLTEWETRGWKSIKGEWFAPKPGRGGANQGKQSAFDVTMDALLTTDLPDLL